MSSRFQVVIGLALAACSSPAPQSPDAAAEADAAVPDAPAPDARVEPDAAPQVTPAFVAGGEHVCALDAAGALRCWGGNDFGQLGVATTEQCNSVACAKLPTMVLDGVSSVGAGGDATCAILADHTVQCFGADAHDALGFPGPDTCGSTPCARAPHEVAGLTATAIALWGSLTCALDDGDVRCAGDNANGQLGVGSTSATSGFAQVAALPASATAVVAGYEHACALLADHTVACWGSNYKGMLGSATTEVCDGTYCSTTPVRVPGLTDVVAIAGGVLHTCALRDDHTVWCWGGNDDAQAGPTASCDLACTALHQVEIDDARELAAGDAHTCVRRGDGTVACWGDNARRQVALDSTTNCGRGYLSCVPTPTTVAGVSGASSLVLGQSQSCALLATGGAMCWGSGERGQFGNGTQASFVGPTMVTW